MKKIISFIMTILVTCAMLFAFATPTFAETFTGNATINEDAAYSVFNIVSSSTVTIKCNIKIKALNLSDNTRLIIDQNGSLTGNNIYCNIGKNGVSIKLNDGGFINLSFHDNADKFEHLLKKSNISYDRVGNHIVAGCSHSEYENYICSRCGLHCPHEKYENGVCAVCGYICNHEGEVCSKCGKTIILENTNTGSILSNGYPEIFFGIGGLAVGFIVAMLIFRKKKVSVNTTTNDKE